MSIFRFFGRTTAPKSPSRTAGRRVLFETLEARNLLAVLGETGSIVLAQRSADQWHTIDLEGEYVNPVVIVGPASHNGGQPAVARVRNAGSDSFQVQIDEWNYLDGRHIRERVGYLVVEAGTYTLPGGAKLEAGVLSTDHTWHAQQFEVEFDSAPILFSQAQTYNGSDAVVTRQRNISADRFEVRLQEEQALGEHTNESVGYVAIEAGTGTAAGGVFEIGATRDNVNHRWRGQRFAERYHRTPVLLASMQTFDGSDPAAVRYRGLGRRGVQFQIEEEQSQDHEIRHTTEVVGYAVFGAAGELPLTPAGGQGGGDPPENLVVNGSFEQHVVSGGWDVFPSIPGWTLLSGPNFELQRGILGGAAEGAQHLELDADVNGPHGKSPKGEQGSIAVSQTVATLPGREYTLSFAFAGRPGTVAGENALGVELFNVNPGGAHPLQFDLYNEANQPVSSPLQLPGGSGWKYYTTTFRAHGHQTELRFSDQGHPDNTLGTFLDDVVLVAGDDQPDPNLPPDLAPLADESMNEGQTLTVDLSASDPDAGDTITLSATGLPAFATFTDLGGGVGSITLAPGFTDSGEYAISVTATDDGDPNLSDTESFTLTVGDVNRAPDLGPLSDESVDEGQTLTVDLSASDPDAGDTITLSATGLPAFATFTDLGGGVGSITLAPGFTDSGEYVISVTATDDGDPNLSDTESFTLTVGDVNRAPDLAPLSDESMNEGETLTVDLSASDPDAGDTITLSATGLPAFATFTDLGGGVGSIALAPGFTDSGEYVISVTATDDGDPNLSDTESFTLTVGEVNRAPDLAPLSDESMNEGETLTVDLSASDPDAGDTITLSATGLPAFATFTDLGGGVGSIALAPGITDSGEYVISVTATDDGDPNLSDTESFTLTVGLVKIDILPGSETNPINVSTLGTVPTAILGSAQFDVLQVNATTVELAGGSAGGQGLLEDINGDGYLDLQLFPSQQDTNFRDVYADLIVDDILADGVLDSERQQHTATLTGQTFSGQAFVAHDQVELFLSGQDLDDLLDELRDAGRIP